MKLAFKFALVHVVVVCLVWGAAAYFQYNREVNFLESDIRADDTMIGHELAAVFADIWQRSGSTPARAFLDDAARHDTRILIRWVAADAQSSTSAGPITDSTKTLKTTGLQPPYIAESVPARPDRFYTLVPVIVNGTRIGSIELSESVEPGDKYVKATIVQTVVAVVIAGLITAMLAVLLGILFVGHPVRNLIQQARQIAMGDLSGRVSIDRKDELGELGVEINAMSDQLQNAYRRISAEEVARLESAEQLRHANRLTTVGKLASSMAHELGTPLNVITARAKMIVEGHVEGPDVLECSKTILEMSNRMTQTMRQVLDLARRRQPHVVSVDLCHIIRQTLSLLTPLARRREVMLHSAGCDIPVHADVDPDQMQQVLSNLIVNGLEAMPRGGNLRIAITRRLVSDYPEKQAMRGQYVCLEVRDEGEGIAEKHLPRVFSPFFTTKEHTGGSGLGLSICADIVREHHGWIDVESQVGRGSTFTIVLPERTGMCEAVS